MTIEGKVALVTGAAVRVGRAIALALGRRGANVVAHYHRSREGAEEVVREIAASGSKAVAVPADIGQRREIENLVARALEAFGRVDVLVNNAAVFYRTPFAAVTEEDWDRHLDLNLKGVFLCCKLVGDLMVRQGGGKIINIADIAGIRPWADYIPYCVSKAGVIALTQGLAKALAPHNVYANAIAPGTVLFPSYYDEEQRRQVVNAIPLKRIGSPEDIARTVLYLAESDFVTGAVVPVDGGRLVG